MAGTERLKPPAMFVSIEEGFQRKSDQSQKESRCQTKRSMSSGAENRSRCPLLTLRVPVRPRRDAPSLLLSAGSIELEARIWFAAPQGRDLRAMKTRPCAPGKINAPPPSTSRNILLAHAGFFLHGANLSSRDLIGRKKQREVEPFVTFGPNRVKRRPGTPM
jgi:hypothetical protein